MRLSEVVDIEDPTYLDDPKPKFIGARTSDGSWDRLGASLLHGAVLFEPGGPLQIEEQRIALRFMFGESRTSVCNELHMLRSKAQAQIDAVLAFSEGRPDTLLPCFLKMPKPIMRIVKIAKRQTIPFSTQQKQVANLLPLGLTSFEIADSLNIHVQTVNSCVLRIAYKLGISQSSASRALTIMGLVMSGQFDLPSTAFSDNVTEYVSPVISNYSGPQLIEITRPEEQAGIGIYLMGGVICWRPNDTLTRKQFEVILHRILGRDQQEIARILNISEHTVHTHLNHALVRLDVGEYYNILLGCMRLHTSPVQVIRAINPSMLEFTPLKIEIGRRLAKRQTLRSIAKDLHRSLDTIKDEVNWLPCGLQGKSQFMMALILGGYLDDLLPWGRRIQPLIARQNRENLAMRTL